MPINCSHKRLAESSASGSLPASVSIARAGKPRQAERRQAAGLVVELHRDEGGTMSIVSVFTLMLLAMILGMVINVGRQVDSKVKMQNAADAATWSGGLVLARGMNTLAFTNHLLCDIFALTACLREAEQQNAAGQVPEIIAAWQAIGPILANSGFPKFVAAGQAIAQMAPMEQQMVQTYSNWIKASADLILPTWEQILQQELVPKFQRALVAATPQLSQLAANEIARQHGLVQGAAPADRGNMQATLWRTSGQVVGGNGETARRTLPVVDPEMDNLPNQSQYQAAAQQQRSQLAQTYLNQWNSQMMAAFDLLENGGMAQYGGGMSQFGILWRGFTCGQLNKLLNQDYPNTNLLFQIRADGSQAFGNPDLEQDYHFIGVCYWPPLTEALPGLFFNPKKATRQGSASADQTYTEISLYIPLNRLVWVSPNNNNNSNIVIGAVPGNSVGLPGTGNANANNNNNNSTFFPGRQGYPQDWTLLNQTWTLKLVPAVSTNLVTILQTVPQQFAPQAQSPQVPALGNLTTQDWSQLNTH